MKDKIKDGLCIASVMAGVVLMIGAEGGDKAGTLSPVAGTSLLLMGLALAAVPMLACWLADRDDEEDADTTETDEDRSDAA